MAIVLNIGDDSKRFLHAISDAVGNLKNVAISKGILNQQEFIRLQGEVTSLIEQMTGYYNSGSFETIKGF